LGGQTDSQVSSQVHAGHKKTHFKVDMSCISLANNRLMDVTQLALTWVEWLNSEKLASTCVDQSECKSSQVNPSVCRARALGKGGTYDFVTQTVFSMCHVFPTYTNFTSDTIHLYLVVFTTKWSANPYFTFI